MIFPVTGREKVVGVVCKDLDDIARPNVNIVSEILPAAINTTIIPYNIAERRRVSRRVGSDSLGPKRSQHTQSHPTILAVDDDSLQNPRGTSSIESINGLLDP